MGGDVAGAYILISWLASTIASPEHYGWRMLWLIGIPVSIVLVLLNHWIPESDAGWCQYWRWRGSMLLAQAPPRRAMSLVGDIREVAGGQ